jgi:glucose/arabinose dehydrogenase
LRRLCWLTFALSFLRVAQAVAGEPPLALGGDPRVDPADFEVTLFATDLPYPMGAVQLQDGSLLVGLNGAGSLFDAPHALVRLVDVDADGVADGSGQVLYTGLPGPAFSLSRAGDLVIAATPSGLWLLRQGAGFSDPLAPVGRLDLAYPVGWSHSSTTVVGLRPAPAQPGRHEIFFNIGSRTNNTPSGSAVPASNLMTASLAPESIWRMTLDQTGAAPAGVALAQIASGLRNAYSGGLDPLTGDLYLADNGIDTPTNPREALSADELDVVPAAAIGGPVESFGFPDTYVGYRTGVQVGTSGLPPFVAFQPVPPPDGSESEGPSAFAFAPFRFPPGLERGAFVGFHGQFETAGLGNEENPVVFVDLSDGTYFHFVSNAEADVGHVDTLLSTADALFALDVSSSGGLAGPASGVIYRIGLAGSCSSAVDTDRDGVCDSDGPPCSCRPADLPGCVQDCRDNCPRRANPEQLDQASPVGTGDVCTCGDLDADGDVDGSDLTAYRRRLAGAAAPFSRDLCELDAPSDPSCDLRDATRLSRRLAGSSAGVADLGACRASTGP